MKRIFLICGAILGVLFVAAVTVPFFIPKEVYKSRIETAASDALGRDVHLNGDVSLSVFPRISASVSDVIVVNPEGFEAENMITAGQLRGSVKWLPLLSKRVDVQEIAFIDASVNLQRREDGATNWELASEPEDTANENTQSDNFDAGIANARLENARLLFVDDVAGKRYTLEDLNLVASLQALNEPLKATADGIFQSQPFSVSLTLDSPESATRGVPASLDFDFKSDLAQASFQGNVSLGDAGELNGAYTVGSDKLSELVSFAGQTLDYDLSQLGQIDASGTISGPLNAPIIEISNATQSSNLADSALSGRIELGETPVASLNAKMSAPDLAALTRFANIESPVQLASLGALDLTAKISGPLDNLSVDFDTLAIKGKQLDAVYTGNISLGETVSLNGALKAMAPQVGDLATQMGVDLPASDAIESIDLSGRISGTVDSLSLSGISAKHSGALLNASYEGDVSLAGDGKLNGKLTANSDELRALLNTANVEMAESDTLKTFSATSALSGSLKNFNFSDLTLKLDDVSAKGNAGINLTGTVPFITGQLDMGEMDLSPFLGNAENQKKDRSLGSGWSDTPLDLTSLKSVNADLNINTTRLTIGNIDLTQAKLQARINDGRLDVTLPAFQGFGGNWQGMMTVDARNDVPAITFDMNGNSVAMSSLLGTLSGFDKLAGTGNFNAKGSSQGQSIAAIMQGLDANLNLNLEDGALKGLNVAQLVRSADSLQAALKNGSLSNLDFGDVLSPSAETDFTEFTTAITVKDGVANVDIMKLLNPVLGIDGTGQINLGRQTLDLRLATSIDKKGTGSGSIVQLNGIPVPVRLSGKWSAPKVSPDMSGIESAIRASLGNQIKDEISDRLGGQLGDGASGIIGDMLGIPQPSEPTTPVSPDENTAPTAANDADGASDSIDEPAAEEKPVDPRDAIEDAAERAAVNALGGLLNKSKKKEAEDTAPAPEQ